MVYQILLRKIVEKNSRKIFLKDATKIALAINSLQDDHFLGKGKENYGFLFFKSLALSNNFI